MKRVTSVAVAAVAAIAIAACGDDDNSSSSGGGAYGGGSSEQAATKAESTPAAGGGTAVKLTGFKFEPGDVTVKVGDKITWTNDDSATHNVTADAGADFKSGSLDQGDTFSFTPTKAGAIAYECTLHPGMTAKIDVTET